MASSNNNMEAALSPSQQEALQQFTAVTNQQPSEALPLLRRSQWNVQIAIAKFFDGETADPVAEALAAQADAAAAAAAAAQQPTASSSSTTGRSSSSSSRRTPHRRHSSDITPAPRIVPTPTSTLVRRSILLTILFFPFSLLYKVLSTSFNLFAVIFPFLRPLQRSFSQGASPRRRQTTNPRDTAARFVREFEESTGVKDLPWFEGGYAQAMDLAKKEVRIMMVILQSEEHDDTHVFNKETLGNTEIINWIREKNIVLWGGSVSDSEGYQVSASLSTTAFPFLALVSLTPPSATSSASPTSNGAIPTSMSTILRISGLLPPQTLLTKLNTALSAHSDSLSRIRAVRQAQLADRQLLQQQNTAYELSLARDRERARQKREAELRKKEEEEQARLLQQQAELLQRKKLAWKKRMVRLGLLPTEPSTPEEDRNAARVSVRFPDGKRVVRKFDRETRIESVYAWVECRELLGEGTDDKEVIGDEEEERLLKDYKHMYGFKLVNPLPRKVFECKEDGGTVGEHLWPSGNLIVEEEFEDEEEEEQREEEMSEKV